MALVLKDRVQETATANTTVSFTCTGAVTGFQAFSVIGNTNTTYYTATDVSGHWESGIGTYTTAGTLVTRTTILASSNSGSAVTFSGTVTLFVSYPATKSINYDANGVATIGQTLGYSDTGLVSSFASTVAGYNQVVVQNKSTATNASSNLNVSNDAGTASANYAELGINSSTFSNGAGCFNIPGAAYVASAGEDLSIGTYNLHNIHFATNSNTTDSMTIYTTGGISLGTYGDPGLGNIAGNKFVAGFTSITSAAGTTVLTAASTYYQRLIGTTTQTIQLPNATTCLVGTTFIFDNNSTGLLTITDGATGAIDVIPAGGVDYIFLIANGTVAGTWSRSALLPSTYNFNITSADFGAATLSNGVWNGTSIAYNYGGTTLTTFVAANNAIYSTSATALTAGTLPVLAGGTGVTTKTGTGSVVLSTSPTLVTPVLGTPTSGTLTNCTFPTLNQNTTGNAATATTATNVANGVAGSVHYQSAASTTAMTAASTAAGQVLTTVTAGGAPTWVTSTSLLGQTDSASPYETALGYQAGNVNTGASNVFVGYQAGLVNTTGVQNTAVGYTAGNTITTGTNNLVLGYNAQASSATVSNENTFGNSSSTNNRFWGDITLSNGAIKAIKTATFNSQTTIATTTGAITINWTTAQNQLQTEPTGTITYTFTAPPGPCHLQLIINSDGTSTAQTVNWPGTLTWMGSTWAGANNKKAVINIWYDGTNYIAVGTNQV